jgi:hypothetical protein
VGQVLEKLTGPPHHPKLLNNCLTDDSLGYGGSVWRLGSNRKRKRDPFDSKHPTTEFESEKNSVPPIRDPREDPQISHFLS